VKDVGVFYSLNNTFYVYFLDVGMGIAVGAGALLVGGKKIEFIFSILA
jgi:hypothetical protein